MRHRLILVLAVAGLMLSTALPAAGAQPMRPRADRARAAAPSRVVDVRSLPGLSHATARRAAPQLSRKGAVSPRSTVAPGSVGLAPTVASRPATIALPSPTVAQPSAIQAPVVGSSIAATSAFVFDSDPSDYVGQGAHATYGGTGASFSSGVETPGEWIWVSVTTATDWWYAHFAAAPGQPLVAGTYSNAVRAVSRTTGQPGIDVYGDGRGCNAIAGSFVVEDISWNGDGSLATFAARFVQHCEGGPAALYGEVRYNSTVPWADKTTPPLAIGPTPIGNTDAGAVTVTSTGTTSVHLGVASLSGPDASSFGLTADSCSAATLAPAATCSFTVSFQPPAARTTAYHASIDWADDTARGAGHILVTGTVPTPTLSVTPASVDFGSTSVGSPLTRAVTVENTGASTDLQLSNVLVDGLDLSSFLLASNGCTAPVAPGHTCQISVTFQPGTYREGSPFTASLLWNDNTAAGNGYVPLTGTDVPATPTAFATTTGAAPVAAVPNFQGAGDPTSCGSVICLEPPDPIVAVGPNHVVEATNVSLRFFNRAGQLLRETALPSFFGEPLGQLFDGDPQVVWDALHGRWLASELSASGSRSYVYLAVSTGADPTGTWIVRSWYIDGILGDFPGLGVSSDKVALSTNDYDWANGIGSSYLGTDTLILDMAAAMASSTPAFAEFTTDASTFTLRPAVGRTAGNDLQAVIGLGATAVSLDVGYLRFTGTVAAGTVTPTLISDLTTGTTALPALVDPPIPLALAGSYPPFDGRPTDATWANGVLWFPATTFCVPAAATAARSCGRISAFSTGATPAKVADFLVGAAALDTFVPGVGVDGDGNAFVGWSQTSATSHGPVSTLATFRRGTDPAGTLHPSVMIGTGSGSYGGHRWGDYLGISPDPLNSSSVWVPGPASAAAGDWTTSLVRLSEPAPAAGTYHPLDPARILDTRTALGLPGAFTNHVARTFQVTGRGNVPAGAIGVTGNLTVTQQTAAGYLLVGPLATNYPTSSTLNFPLGDNRANGVTVALGAGGTLSITYAGAGSSTAQVIFDVTGYFTADMTGATYHALNPARILDTRTALGLPGPFSNHVARTFQVTGAGGVPAGATAVTGNLTVTQQTAAGYLFIGPVASNYPTSSTLNFPLGDNRANGVTVALGSGGKLSITYAGAGNSTAQAIFDVTGYFTADASGARYHALNPARILDTRIAIGLAGLFSNHVARTFPATGFGNVPSGAVGVTGNLTVTQQTAAGYLFAGPVAANYPTSSTLNFPLGDNRANGVVVALGAGGTLSITYAGAGNSTTQAIFDVTGYFTP